MALKLIGAGFGRNGTLSMKLALEAIGFGPCHHMLEVMGNEAQVDYWTRAANGEAMDWDAVFEEFAAMVDWPGCNYYQELAEWYPDAKVLLSVRDPEKWFTSCMNTIFVGLGADPETLPPERRSNMAMAKKTVVDNVFGGKHDDHDHAIAVYKAHNKKVRDVIPADRLLVYEVGSGWDPLCEFLGVPVPDNEFPHVNSTEDFRNNFPRSEKEQDA